MDIDTVHFADAAEEILRVYQIHEAHVGIDEVHTRIEDGANHELRALGRERSVGRNNRRDQPNRITGFGLELLGKADADREATGCNRGPRGAGRDGVASREVAEAASDHVASPLIAHHRIARLDAAHDDAANSASRTQHSLPDNVRLRAVDAGHRGNFLLDVVVVVDRALRIEYLDLRTQVEHAFLDVLLIAPHYRQGYRQRGDAEHHADGGEDRRDRDESVFAAGAQIADRNFEFVSHDDKREELRISRSLSLTARSRRR